VATRTPPHRRRYLVIAIALVAVAAAAVIAAVHTNPSTVSAGGLLVVLGVLLATGTYTHLTSYLARFTPALQGL
jgi:hypothetical protein